MHLIASSDSLGCDDLVPAACESINVDLSIEELFAADGFGYVALLAYDVEGVTSVEFALDGWPSGRGAPPLTGPPWCIEGATTFGNHLGSGGATGLGACIEPDSTTGLILLGYLTFGPLDSTDAPIHLDFLPSTYTEPEDSLLAVTDCTEDFVVDELVSWSGCTIGGEYSGSGPDCPERGGGEDGGLEEDERETPVVRSLGPAVQRARTNGCWVNLAGENVDDNTEVYLISDEDERRSARSVFLGDQAYAYRAATTVADTGWWDIVVSNGPGQTVVLEDALLLVSSLVGYRASACGSDYFKDHVSVKLRTGVLSLPGGRSAASPAECSVQSERLDEILAAHSVSKIERIFRGRAPGETYGEDINGNRIRLSDLSQFYQLWLPTGVDPVDVATDLEVLPEVMQVWLSRPVVDFADTLEPNDYFYDHADPDSTQWNLRKIACPEAWGIDTCSVEILISVIDRGIYYEHEDLGASTTFPNWKVVGGYDFWDDDPDPTRLRVRARMAPTLQACWRP